MEEYVGLGIGTLTVSWRVCARKIGFEEKEIWGFHGQVGPY